jgi:UDP-N-acetylglucosamine--dolichyl-phosphate N-acetylglucosaminephosphotransferase
MAVIKLDHSTMTLPIKGTVDGGILYPLLIVPIGIVEASNVCNKVAGYNGLKARIGMIMQSTLE